MSTHAQRQVVIGDAFLVLTGVLIGGATIVGLSQPIWHSLLVIWTAVAVIRLWPSARHLDQLSMKDRVTRLVLLAALIVLQVILSVDIPVRLAPAMATGLATIIIAVDVLRYG